MKKYKKDIRTAFKEVKQSLWYVEGLYIYLALPSITVEHSQIFKKDKLWDVDGCTWKLMDADVSEVDNSYCMQEQLWAMRVGLA